MLYFNSLPKIYTPDEQGNLVLLTNILTRAKLIDELKNNPMLFYTYSIQDGDTPEIIADKYYDDPNRFWLILYSNEILDPLWDWPLQQQQFYEFIDAKYKDAADLAGKTPYEYVTTTVYDYQKIIQTVDSETNNITTNYVSINETTYNSLVPSTHTYTLPNGLNCTITTDKRAVTIYDHEYELNEAKRNIKILNSSYASQMEQVLMETMSK